VLEEDGPLMRLLFCLLLLLLVALRINKNIQTIHLSHNMITITGFKALFAVVKSQKIGGHIEQLWLDGNSFDEDSKRIRPYYEQMRRILDKNERRGLRKRGVMHFDDL
jgi:hypothetical protein